MNTVISLITITFIIAFLIYIGLLALTARLLIQPKRQPLWSNPTAEVGLPYEDVEFMSLDNVLLKGWFIAAEQTPAPTVIMVHGWPWNRMGTRANDWLGDLPGSKPINLLPVAKALHERRYNVLMFDLRNYGESGAQIPITSGWLEKRDLLGAIRYVKGRSDVDSTQIGTIGFSMGGNTVLFTLPYTTEVKAAVAIQPNTSTVFGQRYRSDRFGAFAPFIGIPVEILYRLAGGPNTASIAPIYAAASARDTPVLYVQGTGDKWGSLNDVAKMVAATPNAVEPIYPETDHRFGGYQYVIDTPDTIINFLNRYMSTKVLQRL